jgi:tripartite-type tricarboxylate transporter receptor subunit TctC
MTAALVFSINSAPADDAFAGKNIQVVVGFSAGGAYDLYARVLSKHMGRHLPGNPKLITQNMPGAGGIKAGTYLYEHAPRDGTSFGIFARGNIIAPLFGQGTFDATKYNWVGSVTDDVNVCMSWHTSKIKTWEDMQKNVFTVAGQGPGTDPNIYANLTKNLFGAPIKIVNGYPGSSEIGLAMERGEVDGVCAFSYSTVRSTYREKIQRKQLNLLFQAGLKKASELPDVPLLLDLARDDRERSILRFVTGVQSIGRPFFAPPGLPEDRVRTLREAFMKTMDDPEFLAETQKLGLPVNPMPGASVNALVDELYRTPKSVIEQAKQMISGP